MLYQVNIPHTPITFHKFNWQLNTLADPGFPVGGRGAIRGGVDSRCGHFSAKMYAKMKELGPVGGACARHAPRSANGLVPHPPGIPRPLGTAPRPPRPPHPLIPPGVTPFFDVMPLPFIEPSFGPLGFERRGMSWFRNVRPRSTLVHGILCFELRLFGFVQRPVGLLLRPFGFWAKSAWYGVHTCA